MRRPTLLGTAALAVLFVLAAWPATADVLIGIDINDRSVFTLDTDTGTLQKFFGHPVTIFGGPDLDSSGNIYLEQFGRLFRIDLGTPANDVEIGTSNGRAFESLDIIGNTGYAADVFDGNIYTVNLSTNVATLVGSYGTSSTRITGLASDEAALLYGARIGQSDIIAVSTSTGANLGTIATGLPGSVTSLTGGSGGRLWFIPVGVGTLYSVEVSSGNITTVLTGIAVGHVSGLGTLSASFCGDGNVDAGEECDDGNTVPNDGCDENCVIEFCGDNIVQTGIGEECDDGNTASGDGCDANCVIEFCGDGIVNNSGTEQCDDGNTASGDGCDANCVIEFCGDGVVNNSGTEECDDGNTVSGDGCDANCVIEFCGDGVVNNSGTEECDDGNMAPNDGCDANCVIEFCGDGVLQTGIGEECDDGNTIDGDGCQGNCLLPFCGDGILDDVEECDDGNNDDADGCQGNCLLPICGDGIVDAFLGEECDDGNNVDADGCQGNCLLPVCGDGIVDVDEGEECDDGNNDDEDGCSGACVLESCGDGIVQAGLGEECDDGNNTDADGCQGNCLLPVCGDGILDTDQGEECDDGNTTDGDGCQGNCLLPFCGDGILDAGEGCDDGNNDDLDGCAANCQLEGACCSDGPNTESECFITTEAGCALDGNSALYLGNGSICETDIDCVALLVQYESWSATATPDGVMIRWTTALEVDTIGFRVLRETSSAREKSLGTVIEMMPALGHGLGGANYELLDPSEHSDGAVYYYLEDIDIYGRVTRHGPISIDRGERETPTSRGEATRRQ